MLVTLCQTEADFYQNSRLSSGWNKKHYYRSILKGDESIFAKLGVSSFVLRQDGTLVVVDWENYGWYPGYWEYGCAMMSKWDNCDWEDWAQEVILD